MNRKLKWFLLSAPAVLPLALVGSARAADDPPATKEEKRIVIVQSSDEADPKAAREKLAKELEKSGLSSEMQGKILKQVDEAMAKAAEAKEKGDMKTAVVRVEAAQKARSDAKDAKAEAKSETEAHTIILNGKPGQAMKGLNLSLKGLPEDIQSKFGPKLQARVLSAANAVGETYRIGIAIHDPASEDSEEAKGEGLAVEAVMEDTPAAKAGIEKGDIVLKVNGEMISEMPALQGAVQKAGKEDKAVTLTLKREGKEVTIDVKPTKTEASDVVLQNLNLLPEGGFIMNPEQAGEMAKLMGRAGAFSVTTGDSSLKKEIDELKSEITELKSMIKQLIEKKN